MVKKKKQRLEHLLREPLPKKAAIAFVCSFCLGDTLMSLVTVGNFIRNGYCVDVFGDYAYALRDWFPQLTIYPLLTVARQKELQSYGVVLHMYDSELAKQVAVWHPMSIILSDSKYYLADLTMVDIQVTLCNREFSLQNVTRVNHIQPLAGLTYRLDRQRVVFHPTSSLVRKNWPAKKFLKLAQWLHREGFDICFLVSPTERADWLWVEEEGIRVPAFHSLSEVAAFIYESGYFIGNDSGLGHLASNLGVPTVSIILRKGVAKQWRPTWALGRVVLSPVWLNPRFIKEKCWKVFTRVAQVKHAFDEVRLNDSGSGF